MGTNTITASGSVEFEARFVLWARKWSDIRAAMVIGSHARIDRPADEWSDLDLLVVANHPERYLEDASWLTHVGVPILTFVQTTGLGVGSERRALFQGGLGVDFAMYSARSASALLEAARLERRQPPGASQSQGVEQAHLGWALEAFRTIASRGLRVVVDKDRLATQLLRAMGERPNGGGQPPTVAEFSTLNDDFWYHVLWTARKLARGELWTAHRCCDEYLKELLLMMITWHAQVNHEWTLDTWHSGRFLEQWADQSVVAHLDTTFARHDAVDVWRALDSTASLFRRLSHETAEALAYPLRTRAYEEVGALVSAIRPQ